MSDWAKALPDDGAAQVLEQASFLSQCVPFCVLVLCPLSDNSALALEHFQVPLTLS